MRQAYAQVATSNPSKAESSMDTAVRMYDAVLALAVSVCVIFVSVVLCALFGTPERLLVMASAVTVLIASSAPKIVGPLAEPGSAVGLLLLQVRVLKSRVEQARTNCSIEP